MCGRLVGVKTKQDMEDRLRMLADPAYWAWVTQFWAEFDQRLRVGNYNAGPMQEIPIIREQLIDGEPQGSIDMALWGLLPVWAKERKQAVRAFNARSETAAEKPTFRNAYKKQRALIPASGYYEWQKLDAKNKQPFYIYPEAGEGLFFAGLYEWWQEDKNNSESWIMSVTILTTAASDDMAEIHNRMPIVMPADMGRAWIDSTVTDPVAVAAMLDEAISKMPDTLTTRPVGPEVGNIRNNGPELIEAV